jgi:carotenoid cleavage dioxygenase-like enzyme
MIYFLILCFNVTSLKNAFKRVYKQFYLQDKFSPVLDEKSIEIAHKSSLFNKLQSNFFGQIGSNPQYIEDEDYHWFDGDGMIHGVFFDRGKISYKNRWILTKRLQVERKWNKKMYIYFGELKGLKGIIQIIKFSIMDLLGFIPQSRGTANTSLLKWKNRIFALHEGDMPYELYVDSNDHNITTGNRFHHPNIHSTTAHPIKDNIREKLYLYGYNNYDFLCGKFIFNVFDRDMKFLNQKNISLINNGMVHDVGFTGDEIIIPDMPLKYDINRIMKEELPMYFDKENGITRFGVFNVSDSNSDPEWFYFCENFFVFHFADARKKSDKFEIFACVMDNLFMEDFVDVENLENEDHIIRGNIRLKKIILDKTTNTTTIITNQFLEKLDVDFFYNLDFPITSTMDKDCIYCTIFDAGLGYIKGYVKIKTTEFQERIPQLFLFPDNMYGNSEPQITVIDNTEYLLSFTNQNNQSFISLIDIENGKIENIEIPTRIPPGFHSILY